MLRLKIEFLKLGIRKATATVKVSGSPPLIILEIACFGVECTFWHVKIKEQKAILLNYIAIV